MDLTIQGKVVTILPVQSGESSNGSWKKQGFIVETDGTYPKKVCISGFNDMADKVSALNEGDSVSVSINIESREYNSRWYTDIKAWKIENQEAAFNNKEGNPIPAADFSSGSDLPF